MNWITSFSSIQIKSSVIHRRPRTWIGNIREIGNVLFEPEGQRRYQTWFTAHQVIGYAYSENHRTWTVRNTFFQHAEDPYVVKNEDEYYMFYEKKEPGNIHAGIGRAHSPDGENWVDDGLVLRKSEEWESHDVSSPVVWVENGIWKMLYEGRSPFGRVGLAISRDGINWLKHSGNPVFRNSEVQGSWDGEQVVCDDIAVFEGKYHLLYHGYNSVEGWRRFMPGLAVSDDLLNWTRRDKPLSRELSHAMFLCDDLVLCVKRKTSDIYVGMFR